jgi:hypothetical protein
MRVVMAYYRDQDSERPFAVAAGRHCMQVEYKENDRAASVYFSFKPGDGYSIADETVAACFTTFQNRIRGRTHKVMISHRASSTRWRIFILNQGADVWNEWRGMDEIETQRVYSPGTTVKLLGC